MTVPTTPTAPPAPSASLARAWREQGIWSAAAGRLKQTLVRSRSAVLVLIVAAAVLEVLAATLAAGDPTGLSRTLAGAGAGAAALAAFIRTRYLGREAMSRWIRARSASEGLKAAAYLYVTRSGEYAAPNASDVLRETVDRVVAQVDDLTTYAAAIEVKPRDPPPPLDLRDYVRARVTPQIDGYYRKRAGEYARTLSRLRAVELALMLATTLLGAWAAVAEGEGSRVAAWVAVLTTIAGALAAHIEASRYQHQVIVFSGTARRLESLRDAISDRLEREPPLTAAESSALVKSCEDAISTENESWMADWEKSTPANP